MDYEYTTSMPISDYDAAVRRLIKCKISEKFSDEQLALAVTIVADIFWFSEAKVRHDMGRGVRAICQEPKPRRRPWGYERREVW